MSGYVQVARSAYGRFRGLAARSGLIGKVGNGSNAAFPQRALRRQKSDF